MKIALTITLALLPSALLAQPASKIVAAADAFVATLEPAQRSMLLFDFNNEEQRARWSNLPVTFVPRAGLKLGDLTAPQRKAAMALMSAALSDQGYKKILGIMEGDESLKTGNAQQSNMFGRDLYFISILGKPSSQDSWMLQFGGHHLALNLTMQGDDGILTPSHTAVQPAKFTFEGKTVRPLGGESDKAFALISALDETQKKQAILNYKVADLVLGPGKDGKSIQPEGIQASALTGSQKTMLLGLIEEWAGIVNDAAASRRMSQIKAHIAETWFAWSGPTTPGTAAYFRIQGPQLLIEYAPQTLGGDPTMHIHTIYRDPTNDYGRKPAAQ